ncbi:CAP domain-containing protein [Sphingobacterium psychroaquaticum]|nr:CAP domain-containing protein [Sphingobacterium psychroaquaticum]
MMIRPLYIFLFFILPLTCVAQRKGIHVNKAEAQAAFEYLKSVRENPAKFMKSLGVRFDTKQVSKLKLNWNEQLAETAEFRAYDMANRGYFDHVTPEGIGPNYYINKYGYTLNGDWLKKISTNNFESIAANHASAVDGIKAFIIGKGSPGFMHRKHVLGMDKWNGSLYDIGIGFVQLEKGNPYKSYLCVIIAKHDW